MKKKLLPLTFQTLSKVAELMFSADRGADDFVAKSLWKQVLVTFTWSRRGLAGAALLASFVVAGCSSLSRDGPSQLAILDGATATLQQASGSPIINYAVVDINKSILEVFSQIKGDSLYSTFGGDRGAAPVIRIGVGDVVQVTVFESQAGGLFIPAEAGVRPGNFVTLPPQQVDRSGAISVPFAEDVHATGKTIPELQAEIRKRLSRAIDPQVIVTLINQRSSQVSVVGDVRAPNKIDVNPRGDRLIDVLAKANGIVHPGYETYVTVRRGARSATVYFDDIVANPNENIFLRPDDTVYVYREPHKFVAFGAFGATGAAGASGGLNNLLEFGSAKLSLAEAVAKAGGLYDSRADPAQVYLYRPVDRDLLERAGVDVAQFDPREKLISVIFRANFRDPISFLVAQHFYMADKDILYVSNSDAYELYKFLDLLNNVSTTVEKVPVSIANAKAAGQAIGR